jgi:hypothetical protein
MWHCAKPLVSLPASRVCVAMMHDYSHLLGGIEEHLGAAPESVSCPAQWHCDVLLPIDGAANRALLKSSYLSFTPKSSPICWFMITNRHPAPVITVARL